MKPVELEIIMRDSTRQGMQSVVGNVEELNQRIAKQNALIKQLEGDLRSMQAAFEKASRAGDQTENIAMVAALKKEVAALKGELVELEKQQKKTTSTPVTTPTTPAAVPSISPLGLKEQKKELKANIKFMEDYVKQYEKSMKGMAPGKEKAAMTQELEGSKAALLAEKDALAQLEAQMGSAGQKQTMLRTQIMNLKQEMAGMTEGTEEYRAAMERLGQMQDQYSDISTQGRIFADDNKNIKATMDAVSGLSGAMTAGVGVASLFGMEEEKLAQIQTKLQAVMAITMGVQQVANTLNKDSYFTHVLLVKVTNLLTAANTRLAISLGISAVAAKVLMATLTLGLSVVIIGLIQLWDEYSDKQDEAIKAQEAATEAAKKQAKAETELRKSAASSVASQLVEYKKLQAAYRELGDDMRKKEKFVKDNQKAFDKLGISVEGVKDAENLLINGEEAFLRTMNNRALVAASMELAAEKYKEAIAKMMEVDAKQKEAATYSAKDLDADDQTLASRMAADKVHQLRGGNFLQGLTDENMEAKLNKLAQIGNKFYTKALAIYNKEKDIAIEEVTRQNKEALERNAEEEKKNVQKFMNEGAESIKNSTKLAQENKDIFSLVGFVPTKEEKADQSKGSSIDDIAAADLKALQKIEAMKIAIMREGAAKEKAESRARFDAELARIDQEEKERLNALVKAKKNGLPVSEEQVTSVTDQSGAQRKLASEAYVKEFLGIEKEYADVEQKKFDELVGKYQDYTARRVSIEKKFNDDITVLRAERDKAQQSGDTAKVDQLNRAVSQATANKGKELIGLDYEQLKETPEYVRAFENLKETSSETLTSLLSQLENAKSAAAQVLSPDQLREYTTTIQEIMDELDSRNPFQSLIDKKQELADAEQELAQAQMALENARQTAEAVKGGGKIEYTTTKFNEKTGKIDSTKAYLTEAQALEKVKEKIDKYNKAKDNVVKTDTKVKKAEKDVKGQIDELANAMSDLGNSIGGQAGEIISLIGDIGSFTMMAMEGVKAAADTSVQAISTVEKASVILAVISAAVQVATKIAKLFKGEDEEEQRKKRLEFYNDIIAIYDKIIDKQKESIKFGYGFASIQAAKEAMENLNKQTEYYRKIASDNATNLIFKPLDLAAYGKALSDLGIKADLGDLIKTDELSNLSSKQLEYIRDNYKGLWASLKDEQRDALQAIIDAEGKSKEIIDAWKESITGISYDSFYTEFIDTLSDMDSSAEDMANNFGEYLKKSILAAMVAKEFQGEIDNLYEMWATAGKEESDGGTDITKDEANDIQEKQKELTEAMIKRREEMKKIYGWQSESEKEQQSGKAGSFTTMSQDQGTKLEGLFTSVQGHVSNIDDLVREINQAMYKAADMLAQIVANTAYCQHLEQMATDIAEMKRDGLKMK